MTTDSEKEGRAEMKRLFATGIATTTELANDYKMKAQTTNSRNESTTMKAFYASVHIACSQHVETLKLFDALIDSLFDFTDKIKAKIANLDKTVQNIADQTGVDITNVQKDITELKETVGPNVKAVIQLFANLQKEQDRRKKNGETMIV
jgi:Mg2+ and Co2+ transporter CorA